jgi:hypothetical protein
MKARAIANHGPGAFLVLLDAGALPVGDGPWEVSIKRYRKPRTQPQNRLFHGICQRIAGAYHMTLDEVKSGVKVEAGWTKLDPLGREVPRSSADCNTVEMARLTEYAIKEALELGVYIQDVLDEIEKPLGD